MTPPRTRLRPRFLLMATQIRSSPLATTNMCFWCTCTWYITSLFFDIRLSFTDPHLIISFIFAMEEFARELISLTVAMSRIYAAERPDNTRRWLARISAAVSSVFCCCLRSRIKPPISESQSWQNDVSVTSKPTRRGLHRRLCTV